MAPANLQKPIQKPDQDKQQDYRKICIMNLEKGDTDEQIRKTCQMYGDVVDFQRPKENLGFATYKTER